MVRTSESLTSSLNALAEREEAFAKVLDTHGHPEPRASEPGVETLLRTIVGQQVSVAAARSMWNKLTAKFGQPVDLQKLLDATDQEMREASLSLAPDARTLLMSLLGGDRLASRSEIRKLTTFAAGKSRVELADVMAVVSDASEIALDPLLDATFAGKTADVEREFNKASGEGSSAGSIVSAALRHVAQLHRMRLMIDKGDSTEFAMMRGAPPVHFSRKAAVETALRQWSAQRLTRAMGQLAEASFEARKQQPLAAAIAQRALLSLAVSARRRDV